MPVNDCKVCALLAASKDFVGTTCLACGADLPSDKFEDELKVLLSLPYGPNNREQFHETLSLPRYANMKYYICELSPDNVGDDSHEYVFTRKMLNERIPGLDRYNIDSLFVPRVIKNLYALCEYEDCVYCTSGYNSNLNVVCNAQIFYRIVKECQYNITKYIIAPPAPVAAVDPYPKFTELLKSIDIYICDAKIYAPGKPIPDEYQGISIYLVEIPFVKNNNIAKDYKGVDFAIYKYDPDFVLVTMEWLHATYPKLKKYDHNLAFNKLENNIRMLQCAEAADAKSPFQCTRGCKHHREYGDCPAMAYDALLTKLAKKARRERVLAGSK